jgi:hypothetical protein
MNRFAARASNSPEADSVQNPKSMFKYTRHTLEKIEELFEELQYKVRYEKGNFQSGYCIVENQKIVVVSKFFETEGRINTLLEILSNIETDERRLSEKSAKFFKELSKLKTVEETQEDDLFSTT